MAERTLEERVRRLEDQQAIIDTLYAYAHAIDGGDEELWLSCWTEDALLLWPAPLHPPYRGHEELRAVFRRHTHAPEMFHKHFVLEPRIEIDGDEARVVSYYTRFDLGEEGPVVRSFGLYHDVFVRSGDGRWRFRERRVENQAHASGLVSSTLGP